MNMVKNLRNMEITTASGRDVTDTKQLSGEAHETPAQRDKNAQKQYTTSGPKKSGLGGRDNRS